MPNDDPPITKRHVAPRCFWLGLFLIGCFIHHSVPLVPEQMAGFMSGFATAMFWWA